MATIKKQSEHSYKIIVYDGYDDRGHQKRHFLTFRPPPGLNDKQIQKAVQKAAYEFEHKIELGFQPDSKITFAEYAEYVYTLREMRGNSPGTLANVRRATARVNRFIGSMRLVDIRPQHLNAMYKELCKPGENQGKHLAAPIVDFNELTERDGKNALAKKCNVNSMCILRLCRGQNVRSTTAAKIEKALKRNDLFEYSGEDMRLAPSTIVRYHEVVYSVLDEAEKNMIVPYNAAARATLPKGKDTKEIDVLEGNEIAEILKALKSESFPLRMLIHLLMVTGCRKGEIIALMWSKLDFGKKEIKIDSSVKYTKETGNCIGSTKTGKTRYIMLPDETIELLKEYRIYQLERAIVSDDGLLFPNQRGEPLHPCQVNEMLDAFTDRHGIRHINPHLFRHTFASILIASGFDAVTVAATLGHKDPNITLRVYSHLIDEQKRKTSQCITEVILHQDKKIM